MAERKEDYRIFVRIQSDKASVDNVLCKVYLPKRVTEPINLIFYPNEEQKKMLEGVFEFSVVGELKGFSGKTESSIKSEKVYSKTGSTVYWGPDIKESVHAGEPRDLEETHFFHDSHNDALQKTVGSFLLTPSELLSPFTIREPSYKGDVKVETIRQIKFTLANGFSLTFDNHYRYQECENGDEITFTELVAEFEIDGVVKGKEIVHSTIDYLDDFLMLASFAERHRCVCLGWDFTDSESHTKFYRRDIAIPSIKGKRSYSDPLIEIAVFEDYIKTAYHNYIQIEPRDLIRHAIQCVNSVHSEGKTIENSFITLYSAIETITLHFRRMKQLEFVLSQEQWSQFQDDLKKWLKNHPLISDDKEKRACIYNKLPELNRIPFPNAFTQLCEHYSVDLSDLWPISNNPDGISLADIRNKIVHGDTFNPLQFRAVICAKEHLIWTIERLLLAILGWPIFTSKVNKDYLSHYMVCHREWTEDQKAFFVQ